MAHIPLVSKTYQIVKVVHWRQKNERHTVAVGASAHMIHPGSQEIPAFVLLAAAKAVALLSQTE